MKSFFIFLQHPDGTFRVLTAERKTGRLAISTIRKNGDLPKAQFATHELAKTETLKFLDEKKLRCLRFPEYKILITEGDPC